MDGLIDRMMDDSRQGGDRSRRRDGACGWMDGWMVDGGGDWCGEKEGYML